MMPFYWPAASNILSALAIWLCDTAAIGQATAPTVSWLLADRPHTSGEYI